MEVCARCRRPTRREDFALMWNRSKTARRRSLCKLCISEEAKASIRLNQSLPRYITLLREYPMVKLESEASWLKTKLKAVKDEMKARE